MKNQLFSSPQVFLNIMKNQLFSSPQVFHDNFILHHN